MKRKIFSTLLALVLVLTLGLVTGVPVAAQDPLDVVPFILEDDETNSTATWSTEYYAGTSSVELVNPDVTNGDNYANVWFYLPGDVTLAEIDLDTTSFQCYSDIGDFIPYLMFEIPGEITIGEDTGDLLRIANDAEPSDDFVTDFAEFVAAESSSPEWQWEIIDTAEWTTEATGWDTWENLVASHGTLVVDCVVVELSDITTSTEVAHIVYVDDITVSGTTFPVEPVVLVDDDFTSATPGWGTTHFDIIQDGVGALPFGTVIVADGTYNENIVLDVEGLTLQAASSPVIDGLDTLWVPAVDITAADVTLQGFSIQNFKADVDHDSAAVYVRGDGAIVDDNIIANITPVDPEGDPFGLGIDVWTDSGANTDIDITTNVVHDVGSIGIRVRDEWRGGQSWSAPAGPSRNVLVEGNEVYNCGNSNVLITGFAQGVTVIDNEIYDSSLPNRYGIRLCIYPSDVTIEDNHIHGNYRNIVIAGADDVTIVDNTIEDTASESVNIYILNNWNLDVYEPADWPGPWVSWLGGITVDTLSTNVVIENNDILGAAYGVKIESPDAADPSLMAETTTINLNNISDNTDYGVLNEIETDVNAKVNYWGDISGPEHEATNPGGIGDIISDYVHYLPWLTADFQTVLDDNICYFGIPMVYLNTGWNTFSTPVALDSACDQWDEYVALGDGLAIHSTSPAYAFDGAIQDWLPLIGEDADYWLKPCDAIYVRMAEPDIAAILYSPDVSVPSKDLYAGWNLVSLAYDPEDEEDTWMPVEVALDTVYEVTGDLTGCSLVVSPPVNFESWFLLRDGLEGDLMFVTDGYWVFMKNPGTLAGFSFTPIPYE